MIRTENIQALINKNKEDAEILSLIEDCLNSFCEYHVRIYKMETFAKLYDYHNMAKADYQDKLTALDKSRSTSHNAAISNIGILNRLCQRNSIPLVYEGVVSTERPHRVEIADAVLSYVEEIVKQRRK